MITRRQMLDALDGLILEAQRLLDEFRQDCKPWTGEFAAWLKACESTVEAIFGTHSEAFRSFKATYFQPPTGEQYANDIEAIVTEEMIKAYLEHHFEPTLEDNFKTES